MERIMRPTQAGELSRESIRMLRVLHKLRKEKPPVSERAELLLRRYEKTVRAAIRDIVPGRSRILWMFCFPKRKRKVCASCNYLFDVQMLGLGPEFQKLKD